MPATAGAGPASLAARWRCACEQNSTGIRIRIVAIAVADHTGRIIAALEARLAAYPGDEDLANGECWL
jgi:hypothetical protein